MAGVEGLFNARVPAEEACKQFLGAFQRKRPWHKVRINKSPHVAIFAPTSAGKSSGLVIPYIRESKESCIVPDYKGELFRETFDIRSKLGPVAVLDPYKRVTQSPDTYDPIDFVFPESEFAIDDCRDIAAAIVERKQETGDGIHFLDNAEGGIAGVAATVVAFGEGRHKSLQAVSEIVSNPLKWQATVQLACSSTIWDGMLARMGGNLLHWKDKELASSMSTIARFMRFLSTPAIAASTSKSSFDPANLVRQTMTIYMVLPVDRMDVLSPLLRLWVSSFIRAVIRNGGQR
jgi:type IV secretion system protein VirD4